MDIPSILSHVSIGVNPSLPTKKIILYINKLGMPNRAYDTTFAPRSMVSPQTTAWCVPPAEEAIPKASTEQASLFEQLGVEDAPASEVPTEEISYRRWRKSRGAALNDSGLRFDESVPVTTIEVKDPAVEAIPESERVLVGENVTCRLAQERASYRVLRYVLPVVKRRDTGAWYTQRAAKLIALGRTARRANYRESSQG